MYLARFVHRYINIVRYFSTAARLQLIRPIGSRDPLRFQSRLLPYDLKAFSLLVSVCFASYMSVRGIIPGIGSLIFAIL